MTSDAVWFWTTAISVGTGLAGVLAVLVFKLDERRERTALVLTVLWITCSGVAAYGLHRLSKAQANEGVRHHESKAQRRAARR